jgi:adenylosuccinate lyase
MEKNLALPGNPRYQPKDLITIFGYDNLARTFVEVELAALSVLHYYGRIPEHDYALLTPEVKASLLTITTSEMDKREREVTKHDVRALVQLMQERLPEPLRRFVHVPLTSYDVLNTAQALQFSRAHIDVIKPKVHELVEVLRYQAEKYAHTVQIGRTHGQHALPITVGFWFATILNRVLYNASEMNHFASGLVGKISGAVGAYNAQHAFGLGGFEGVVLLQLGLPAARISTQILPPEPLAYYLCSLVAMSAALGQFGRDGRNLMRTEIAELTEPFGKNQVGSSTMAHKRNPINFENVEGTWLKTRSEFGKVLDTMVSDHQRDLVGSSLMRDLPTIVVNLVSQLDTLLRQDKEGVPFVKRIVVDETACARNLALSGDRILAEPLYIMLQLYGYPHDAHHLINHQALPLVDSGQAATLLAALYGLAEGDKDLSRALVAVPKDTLALFADPAHYIGNAVEKTLEICQAAEDFLKGY